MKHLTITLVLTFIAFNAWAQKANLSNAEPPSREDRVLAAAPAIKQSPMKGGGDIFWQEAFDWADPASQIGWLLPAGWSWVDPDDIGYNWHWANDTLKGVYTNEPPLNSDTKANGFLALNLDGYNKDIVNYNDYRPVNNSIISSVIDCSAHSSVLVKLAQNFRYWSEADMFFEVTNDNGSHWAPFDMKMGTLYSERVGGIAAGEKVDLFLNISDVAAGMPRVQFKITWRKARLYYWMIDDITFMEGWDNDIQMLYYEANYDNGTLDKEGFFYSVPKTQISGYDLMAVIRNFGNIEQWGTHLSVQVTKNNQVIYDEITVPYQLYPTITDTFRIAKQFIPGEFGHYQIDFSAKMANVDEIPGDNHSSIPFQITDSLFSRCDNKPEVSFSTWGYYTYQHEGDVMGTWYTLKKDEEISSISCYIHDADIRSSFRFVLYAYNVEDDAAYELLGSEFMQMDSTILKEHWVTMPLMKDGEGEFLKADNSYMVAVEFWNNLEFQEAYDSDRYSIGSDRSNFYPSGKCWFYQTENQEWWSSGDHLFMIQMNVNNHENMIDGIDNRSVASSMVMQNFPNPFNDETTIAYSLGQSSDIQLNICDITGRVVWNQKFVKMPAGDHKITLSGASFQPGTYLYTIQGKDFTQTKWMVVR